MSSTEHSHTIVQQVTSQTNERTEETLADPVMNHEYLLWKEIQDIVGPASFWPQSVRRYFWMPYLSRWQRTITVAFIAVNALNPEVYDDLCELKSFFRRGSRMHQHFQQLFAYFRQGRLKSLCSWHVLNIRFQSIGPIRYSFL